MIRVTLNGTLVGEYTDANMAMEVAQNHRKPRPGKYYLVCGKDYELIIK